MSSVEFIGTLAALACGIVLGSLYMGIDPQTLVHGMLEQTSLGESADGADIDASSSAPDNYDESQSEGRLEEADGDRHPTALRTENEAPDESASSDSQATNARQSRKTSDEQEPVCPEATKSYWKVLTQVMTEEVANRTGGIADPEQWQLLDYLVQRKQGHQSAIDTLKILDTQRIDPRVLQHSSQVSSWHAEGTMLFERARKLLTDGPTPDLSGPFAQSWQRTSTQHRMEERLVHNKNAAVAKYLDHTYPEYAPFKPAF